MNPADAAQVGSAFSLASPAFAAFCIGALALMAACWRAPSARTFALAGLNLGFLFLVGGNWYGWLLLGAFAHAAFAITWIVRRFPEDARVRWLGLLGIAACWVLLFVNKNMDVFGQFIAFKWLDVTIVGMSYLAFRAISTLQEAHEIENFSYLQYFNYLLFFPTLLAGPIERYERFRADLAHPVDVDTDVALQAAQRITLGFMKKFVLADNLAPFGVFAFGADPSSMSTPMLWLGVVLQLWLIYLDFSGYCDIVLGLARLMGFQIQENFDRPYLARNIQDFWNRWHMSLTFFVRDYVFTPICRVIFWHVPRKRQFPYVTMAYFFTMLVIALWHKISWGFLLFGLMHGVALTYIQIKRKYLDRAPMLQGGVGAFLNRPPVPLAIALTWVFFSLSTVTWFFPLTTTWQIFKRLFGLG